MTKKPGKSLIKANPYLRNPRERKRQFVTAVLTSTAVEGVKIKPDELKKSSPRTSKRKQ
jgi:hypothetical protein